MASGSKALMFAMTGGFFRVGVRPVLDSHQRAENEVEAHFQALAQGSSILHLQSG
jgi:hypothetical protein